MSKRSRSKSSVSSSSFDWSNFLQKVLVGLFHLLVLTVPLFFLVVNEELFEFNKMVLTYGLTGAIVTVWLARMVVEKRLILQRTPVDFAVVAFVASQLLSTLFSIHVRTSLFGYYTRFHGGFISTLTYLVLFYAFVSTVKKSQLIGFLRSILFSALLVSLYAIPEHFGHSPSCLVITGNFDASCWVQDVQTRVFATFGQPNWLAAYAVMVIPVGVALGISAQLQKSTLKQRFFAQILPFLTATLLFITLLYTKSRSGFVAIGTGLGLMALGGVWLLSSKDVAQSQKKQWGVRASILGIAFALLAAVIGTPFTPQISSLLQTQVPQQEAVMKEPAPVVNRLEVGGTDSGEIRKIVWQGAFDVWKRYPLFGSGVETFAYSYFRDRPMSHNLVSEWDFLYNKAHNEFLNFLATTGLVGLATYLILQGLFFWVIGRVLWQSKDDQDRWLALGLLAGMAAIHVSNFFGFSTVMVSILMYIFPAIAIVLLQRESEARSVTTLSQSQYLGLFIVAVVGSYLILMSYLMWYADFLFARAKTFYTQNYYPEALAKIDQAIAISPNEALFYELKSQITAEYAIGLIQIEEAEQASQLASTALDASDRSLLLNPVHLNFYKTRMQILLTLAQAQPDFYQAAIQTLNLAQELAPTDPKLVYNEGIITHAMGDTSGGIEQLKLAVEMKPNYEAARYQLGQLYEKTDQPLLALEQYNYILQNINPTNEVVQGRAELVATAAAEITE